MSIVDLLAADYLKQQWSDIDHGIENPRGGGFSIMQDLQDDLVEEQRLVHGSDTEVQRLVDRLFTSSDLYEEMVECDDYVVMERSNIVEDTQDMTVMGGVSYREVYYSISLSYRINLKLLLGDLGVVEVRADEVAKALENQTGKFVEYIEKHDPRDLFGKWLPPEPTDLGYHFGWEAKGVSYIPECFVGLKVDVLERYLKPEVTSA